MRDQREGLAPPPRGLMAATVSIFLLLVLGGIGGFLFLQSRPPLSSLLQAGIILAVGLTVFGLLGGVVFRKRLPRLFLPGLVIALAALWIIGSIVFVLVYRGALQPGQRETAKYYLPFLEVFDPALPSPENLLPTVAPDLNGGISPEDLLSRPFGVPTTAPEMTEAPPAAIQVEPSPTATPTLEPSATPTPEAVSETTPEPPQAVESQALNTLQAAALVRPSAHQLYGFTYVKQTWNNCGPANITMALSYFGWQQGQEAAAAYLKPSREDKNVSPHEMVAFVNENSGVRALTRPGGDMELIKRFIASDFPVIVESVLDAEAYDWIGHYETIAGYDDAAGVFYIYDSFVGMGDGRGNPDPYIEFDRAWQSFNRIFIVLYRQEDEARVREILGERADPLRAAELAAEAARQEAEANPANGYAWFNLGSSLTRLGRYEEAAAAYDKARQIGMPWRITLYQFGPFEAYFERGRYDDVMALVKSNLNYGGEYVEETHYWKGKVEAAQGKTQQAVASFQQALAHNPRFTAAKEALDKLSL